MKFHFNNDNNKFDRLSEDEIEPSNFIAGNLYQEMNPYKNLHKKFADKNNWKPNTVHQCLDIFQRSLKIGLLNSKIKTVQ